MAGGASLESFFEGFSKLKNNSHSKTLESGPAKDYKNLSPEQQREWRKTGEPPANLKAQYAKDSHVDDGTSVHPSNNKTTEKLDPTQKDVQDVGRHAKPQMKDDTVSFSGRNSNSSQLSGKTAVDQPVNGVLRTQQNLQKLYNRSATKLGFKKKEAPKSEYQKEKEISNNWADSNLNGIQRTHFNQLSRTQQDAWRSSGKPPENLEKYYKQMTHTNFPDRELLAGHSKAMTEKYGTDAGRSKESIQREAKGVEAQASEAARKGRISASPAYKDAVPNRQSVHVNDEKPPSYEKAEADPVPFYPEKGASE